MTQYYGGRFRGGIGKESSSTSPAIPWTPQYVPLWPVQLQHAGEEVKAVEDTEASIIVLKKCLTYKLVIWKRAWKVKVRKGDGSILEGNFVLNTCFKVRDFLLVSGKFTIDGKVLYVGSRDLILGLSWFMENAFLIDTQDRCLRHVNAG